MLKKKSNKLYRMPAEWEKQNSTLIGWPYNEKDWPNRFENIPDIFAKIISKISHCQKVRVLIQNNILIHLLCSLPEITKNNDVIATSCFIILNFSCSA